MTCYLRLISPVKLTLATNQREMIYWNMIILGWFYQFQTPNLLTVLGRLQRCLNLVSGDPLSEVQPAKVADKD